MFSAGELELFRLTHDTDYHDPDTLLDTNRNKCPQSNLTNTDLLKDVSPTDVLAVADIAKDYGLFDMSWRLSQCCRDGVVFRTPSDEWGWTPIRCDHRLCPWCSQPKALELRRRLKEVADHAQTMITLTMATYKDRDLRKNIDILRKAFRMLTQRKHKYDWIPFERGYFWRLEVTPGKGFHPHLHVLSCEEWIDYHRLRKRWGECLDHAGGKGDLLWISVCRKKHVQEAAKYLSKSLVYFAPARWFDLDKGLTNVRTYGSGRLLKLPPKKKKGNTYHCLLSKIGPQSDIDLLQWLEYNRVYDQLQVESTVAYRLRKFLKEDTWFGYCN